MTLYMGEFPPSCVKDAISKVRDTDLGVSVGECSAASLSLTEGGYIEVGYSKTVTLIALQARVAAGLVDLALPVAIPLHVTPSANQRDNIVRYKYELMGDSFRPHITLGRLAPEGRMSLWPLKLPEFSFWPTHLVIGEADEQGSMREIWAERRLQSPKAE
jgi:hypothetical protein